jgi:hypothetical protein
MTRRRALIWAAIMTALAGVLAFVPVFNVVGYELSFVVALVASFGAADLAAAHAAHARAGRAPEVWGTWSGAAGRALAALLAPPLVVMALNALRVDACDPWHGLAFYALLPAASVLCAVSVGTVAGLLLPRRTAIAASWLFVLASMLLGVHRFYATPAIFAYDPFGGYFAGTLYDEDITLPAALFWARGYHAAVAACALAGLDAVRRLRLRSALLAVAAGAAALLLHARSGALGFEVTSGDIAEALGGRLETEHFVIHYPLGAPFVRDLPAIARDHELRYVQAARAFGLEGTATPRIASFYFGSREDKARWMGARDAYIAKPWRHEMYLAHEEFPHDSLRHEIAHVLAGGFGDPIFGISVSWWGWPPAFFNVGLIEGAAVAADWPTAARLTPHEASRAMLEMGMLPPVSTILAPGFFLFSSARSYTTAGSFVRFLLDTRGPEKFRALYRSGGRADDFRRIYGVGLDGLETEWRALIASLPLPAVEREIARERYRRPGIFKRPCPHQVARLDRLAAQHLAEGRADLAVPLYVKVCAEDPAEPARRFPLATALERAGRVAEAIGILAALGGDADSSTPLRARALLRLCDLEARRGGLAEARRAAEEALALPVDEATERNLRLRLRALDGARPESAALARYLFAGPTGGDPDPVVLAIRARAVEAASPALGRYLTGRLLYQQSAWVDAAAALSEAHALGLDEPLVARENDRLLVAAAYLAGDLATARAAARRMAAPDRPPEVRRAGADWLARCDFAGK